MAGGAPAGIKMVPGELGWRTNSTRMSTSTMQGKSTTTPSGTDIRELPRRRSGLLKKARRPRRMRSMMMDRCWCSQAGLVCGDEAGKDGWREDT